MAKWLDKIRAVKQYGTMLKFAHAIKDIEKRQDFVQTILETDFKDPELLAYAIAYYAVRPNN